MTTRTPMQFVQSIARMRPFRECQAKIAAFENMSDEEARAFCDGTEKDMDWLINDSADLEQLIQEAREILVANTTLRSAPRYLSK
jgi:hypothetical protein